VYAGATPANLLGEGRVEGAKDDVARTALQAALAALDKTGVVTPDEARARMLAPFARDSYAFVLYGRGVAAYTGLDQPWDPIAGKPAGKQLRRPPPGGVLGGNAERALKPLGKSLLIDPRVPETRRYVGLVHLGAGRPGHARAAWSYAVDVQPDYAAAVLGLAMLDRT